MKIEYSKSALNDTHGETWGGWYKPYSPWTCAGWQSEFSHQQLPGQDLALPPPLHRRFWRGGLASAAVAILPGSTVLAPSSVVWCCVADAGKGRNTTWWLGPGPVLWPSSVSRSVGPRLWFHTRGQSRWGWCMPSSWLQTGIPWGSASGMQASCWPRTMLQWCNQIILGCGGWWCPGMSPCQRAGGIFHQSRIVWTGVAH